MSPAAALLLTILFALLGWAMVTDWRHRTIGNGLNAAVAGLAPAWWWACGLHPAAIGWQVALALLLFLLFVGLFALGAMGGGDVKLIAAVTLWLPPMLLVPMLWWMAVSGGVLTAAMIGLARLRPREGAIEVPYGLAIAGSAMAVLANHFLTNPGA